jgi:hypothetical protein
MALEAADRLASALAFAASAGDVVACGLVAAGAGDDDALKRGVDLAVAALVEPRAAGLPRGDRGVLRPGATKQQWKLGVSGDLQLRLNGLVAGGNSANNSGVAGSVSGVWAFCRT